MMMLEDNEQLGPLRTPLLDPAEESVAASSTSREFLSNQEDEESSSSSSTEQEQSHSASSSSFWHCALHTNLFPDNEWFVGNQTVVEGTISVKLIKFLVLTFGSIWILHGAILHRNNHKDSNLTFEDLWKFDADLIARDSISFFLVGRLWEQPQGVDHLAWIGMMVLSNVYWESQHYIPFLRHSFTLYEMHCVWPWPLWIFVAVIVTFLAMLMVCHVVQAYQTQVLRRKIVELVICLGLFLAPVVSSPYFHFHHWYAGWLLGMHSNFPNLWWSRAIMAWCWGTYVNGIAVYGRDPVLTCELAYFLSADQRCPFLLEENSNTDECQRTEILSTIFLWQHTFGGLFWNDDDDDDNITTTAGGMDPAVDWRNCSAHGYHP